MARTQPQNNIKTLEEVTGEKDRMTEKCWVSNTQLRSAEKQSFVSGNTTNVKSEEFVVSTGSYGGERMHVKKMKGKEHLHLTSGKAEFGVWEHNERKIGGFRGL